MVVAAGEGKELGPVVGPDHAKEMPTAVANPIFVDTDGGGFKPNGDMLGLPLPIGRIQTVEAAQARAQSTSQGRRRGGAHAAFVRCITFKQHISL